MSTEQPGIGKLITGDENNDAIHVAIAPVIAAERLKPGQRIRLTTHLFQRNGSRLHYVRHEMPEKPAIGIVDPFLTKDVEPEQGFYMFLLPGTITSLRHEWTHPAFEQAEWHRLRGETK
jgi:hypothetical protein